MADKQYRLEHFPHMGGLVVAAGLRAIAPVPGVAMALAALSVVSISQSRLQTRYAPLSDAS
jgi:hypothetical protein